MGWQECSLMDEKLKFIARLLEGEKMAPLCREFGISRKTGHKLWGRYKDMGNEALIEQKRTPYRYANKIPLQIEIIATPIPQINGITDIFILCPLYPTI